jgi:outer membrane protein assembly factor BamD
MFRLRNILVPMLVASFLAGCSFHRRKYENPIKNDSEQPDKILFDKAVKDIEKGRYQIARLTLNTLMNTYDSSEYMAKAKLAIADSWMREGGSTSFAQAEAEYKDFILFYPGMEESAEAQEKICMLHYRQMEKPDRDPVQAIRAEDECKNLLLQFPNSKFAPRTAQLLRNIQEARADGEYRVGEYYFKKGSLPAAANRLENTVNTYPLYSGADNALWMAGSSYSRLGPRFRPQAVESYQRILRDYPLSEYAADARKQLQTMEAEIPEANPEAEARMKYELENYDKPGKVSNALSMFRRGPDMSGAAKQGTPQMDGLRPSIPVSVPTPEEIAKVQQAIQDRANGATTGSNDVGAEVINGASALDTQPDSRLRNQQQQQQQQQGTQTK